MIQTIQSKIIDVLQRHGSTMRYRDLCRRLHSSQFPAAVWQTAYQGLQGDAFETEAVIRESVEPTPSGKFQTKVVTLLKPSLQAPPLRRGQEEKIAQEEQWATEGWDAFLDGKPITDWPRFGKPYSGPWYRAKSAWQSGWRDAKRSGKPEKEKRILLSR